MKTLLNTLNESHTITTKQGKKDLKVFARQLGKDAAKIGITTPSDDAEFAKLVDGKNSSFKAIAMEEWIKGNKFG